MQVMWVCSLGREDPLEKDVATHSRILAWEIPRTEKPGGPQSTGLQKSHNLETNTNKCIIYSQSWSSTLKRKRF